MYLFIRTTDSGSISSDAVENSDISEEELGQIYEMLKDFKSLRYLEVWSSNRQVFLNPDNIVSVTVFDPPHADE